MLVSPPFSSLSFPFVSFFVFLFSSSLKSPNPNLATCDVSLHLPPFPSVFLEYNYPMHQIAPTLSLSLPLQQLYTLRLFLTPTHSPPFRFASASFRLPVYGTHVSGVPLPLPAHSVRFQAFSPPFVPPHLLYSSPSFPSISFGITTTNCQLQLPTAKNKISLTSFPPPTRSRTTKREEEKESRVFSLLSLQGKD